MKSKNRKILYHFNYLLHKFLKFVNFRFNYILDETWYLRQYPDVKRSGHNPLKHWVFYGLEEKRDPTEYMFTKYYLRQIKKNSILLKFNPTIHYFVVGKRKKYNPHPNISNYSDKKIDVDNNLNNADYKNDLLRTPNRINVSDKLGNISNFFHIQDIYVSNVDRDGEITNIKEIRREKILVEIYKFREYSLEKLISKESNKLRFKLPANASISPRRLIYTENNEEKNTKYIKKLNALKQKHNFEEHIELDIFKSMIDDFYALGDRISSDTKNLFLDKYINNLKKVLKNRRLLDTAEFTNIFIFRDLILNYFAPFNLFLQNQDNEQIIKLSNISLILATKRANMLGQFFSMLEKQKFKNFELLISLHGMSESEVEQSKKLINKFSVKNNIYCKVWENSKTSVISEILNNLIVHCKFEYIAKIDDDDIYGENHLLDLVVFAIYTNADFLGKSPMFIYDQNTSTLFFDNKHYSYFDNSDEISGSSMIFKKGEVLNLGGVPFCVKNPDYVLRQLFQNRKKRIFRIYGYNHIIYRSNLISHNHTWHDINLLSNKVPLMNISVEKLVRSCDFWKI